MQVTLCTTVENQPVALVEVYEGESAAARENAVVASITLPLVPAPFGSPNILVRMTPQTSHMPWDRLSLQSQSKAACLLCTRTRLTRIITSSQPPCIRQMARADVR